MAMIILLHERGTVYTFHHTIAGTTRLYQPPQAQQSPISVYFYHYNGQILCSTFSSLSFMYKIFRSVIIE